MPTLAIESSPVDASLERRQLMLVWQNPRTRTFSTVGRLEAFADGSFEFAYEPAAQEDPEFFPLDEFPDLSRRYGRRELPAFFSNRVMASDRPSFPDYLAFLNLDPNNVDVPVEVLVRTGAPRATDTFHIVERPTSDARQFTSRFFVSGIRHTPGAASAIEELAAGDRLAFMHDHDNEHNPDAHVVVESEGRRIGWVPDWLCSDIARLRSDGWSLTASVERVNPQAPPHVRVLCRVDLTR